MNKNLAAAAVAVVLAGGAAAPALAHALDDDAPAPHSTHAAAPTAGDQTFAMTFSSTGNDDGPVDVVAAGPVSGHGTMTQSIVKEGRRGSVLRATITLPDGTVVLQVIDHESMKVDVRSCTARQAGQGTWKIVSGTGAFGDASGTGRFVRRGLIVGAFDDDARCLGQSAPPAAEAGTVVATGSVTR